MALSDEIKTIVESLYPKGTFMLASDFEAQREANDINYDYDFPLIILNNMLTENDKITQSGAMNNEVDIMITVLKPDDWDTTDNETNIVVEECKGIARRIMINIFNLSQIRNEEGNFSLTPVIRDWNVILSGVIARAKWTEYKVVSC